jgi:membrane protease YdiL (CAAX protease family)
MKKICFFLWRMIYPLLLYQMIVEIVFLLFCMVRPDMAELWEIQLSAVGALAAEIPMMLLYKRYREQRVRALETGSDTVDARPEPFGYAVKFDVSSMILLTELGVCMCLLSNAVLMELPISWESYEEVGEVFYEPPVMVQMLCIGIIIPLAEELVFRGLGYYKMRSLLPALPCMLISAIYFGVFHGNLVQGIYAGVLGMILAGVMEWYGTLTAPYLVHASANMMSVLVSNTIAGMLVGGLRPVRQIVIVICTIWLIKILKDMRRDGSSL